VGGPDLPVVRSVAFREHDSRRRTRRGPGPGGRARIHRRPGLRGGSCSPSDSGGEGSVMADSVVALSLAIAAIGAGLMAGVYFAFSGFIMRSLDQLGAAAATDAMNAINEVILR